MLTLALGVNRELHLRAVADALVPATLWSQDALTAFERTVKEYRDAVFVKDPAALDRAFREGRRVLTYLRAEAAIPGLGEGRTAEAKQAAAAVEQFLTDAETDYRVAARSGNLSGSKPPQTMTEITTRTQLLRSQLQRLKQGVSSELQQQLGTLETGAAGLHRLGLLTFAATLGFAALLVNLTIRRSITGRLLASQAALARERDLLGTLIDAIPDYIFLKDRAGRYLRVNRAQSLLMRISNPQEAVQRTAADFFDPAVAQRSQQEEREIICSGEPLVGRIERLPVTGVPLTTWVTTTKVPVKDDRGRVQGIVGVSRDISDWKEATDALQKSEETSRLLFAAIPHAVWVYDAETLEFLEVNETAIRLYGYSAAEFRQMVITDVHPAEDAGCLREAHAFLDLAQPPGGAWRHRTKDGRILDVEVSGHVFEFKGRKAILAVVQDITERKRLQVELHQAQRLEAVGQLASGIAHEINTPIQYVGDNLRFLQDSFQCLQAFSGNLERLLLACGPEETALLSRGVRQSMEDADLEFVNLEVPKAIAQSLDGVERVATIVRAMKEFAHPGQKQKVAADINQALANALIVARNEFKYVAEVETDFGELSPVVCDIAEMNQVFLNLLINAAHAIGEVMQKTSQRGKITIRTRQVNDRAEISISDTGCGIPAQIQSKVFDPFFTTKPVGRGTGQGLAIARSIIVEKHGGSLTFEANGTQGTTFIVSVPLEAVPACDAAG